MADLFTVFSDPTRLRILMQLRACGEACVSDIAAWTKTNESVVSHALRLLDARGVVASERRGRWVFYTLADARALVVLDATVAHLVIEHR
jgi:DNA-binding transcriptional ArsR family regulator